MGLLVFYILLALGVSFICSILEAVLLSVTPGFIKTEIGRGKAYARDLEGMKNNLDKPISAILTLNTIAHTMGAAGAGAQWKVVSGDTAEAIFAAVLTILVLIFSEIIPKTIGATFWRTLAAPSTMLLRWMISLLTYTGILWALSVVTRLLGGKSESHGVSRSELAAMAELSSQAGKLDSEESEILRNLFRMKSMSVRSIMTPRIVVFASDENSSIDSLLETALHGPFSRIPIYKNDVDHVTGFVLKADIMAAKISGNTDDKTLVDFRRSVTAVQGSVSVYEAFQTISQDNTHIMLVVDEFGALEGIVTMEDIVETLLGMEIMDEVDHSEDMQALARKLWRKRAKAMGIVLDEEPIGESNGASVDKPSV